MAISKILGGTSAFIVAASLSALGFAACSSSIGPVGNPGTWTADASGEILTYSGNGLSYTKCQLGTSGPNCATGSVQTFDWQGALQASVTARIGGFSDWRVPNLQEAVALIEPTCEFPALSSAFPAASGGQQWTSTSSGQVGVGDGAWNINSFAGSATVIAKFSQRAVILVRGSSTPAGNFDSLPSANVTLTPSVSSIGQGSPFNVVVSTANPVTSLLGVSLNVLTQPSGPAGSLSGSVFCSIPSGSSSCTVTGVELTGPAGAYTLGASTAGGPAGGVTVNASPTIQLLSGPTASLSAPASATQFAPFNVTLTMTSPATADTTFELVQTGGPAGALGGSLFCTVPSAASACTFTGVTFSGYGNGLAITAGSISGPSVPVTGTTLNINGLPVNILMGAQASQIVNIGFSTVFQIDVALPIPLTMSSQVAAGGPAGTFTPASCVIPAGSLVCSATGNTFSAVGLLFLEPLIVLPGAPILVQSRGNAAIDIVNQNGVLSAPATVTQASPFNVTLTLAAGATSTTTYTLSRISGPTGTLSGGTTCTITAGNLSCTFTGVTFSGVGPSLVLTATPNSGPALPVTNATTEVLAAPLSYAISIVLPPTATTNTPFNVVIQSNSPVAFNVPVTIAVANGPSGTLSGPLSCTILSGQSSCTLTGVAFSAAGNLVLSASTTASGAAFAFEQGAVVIANAPEIAPTSVPTGGPGALLLLLAAVAALGAQRLRAGSARR